MALLSLAVIQFLRCDKRTICVGIEHINRGRCRISKTGYLLSRSARLRKNLL